MLDEYPDGVWLVELAPLGDSTLVVQAVAKALGVEEQAGKDLAETVAEWLGSRQQLLLLDNAEHLLEACAQLADLLLRRCPRLVVLVTSRERLGIDGELTYRVPSLSVPEARHDATREEVLACEAARLFIDRARLQRPDFEVTAKDAAALASICRRLDGIALAIELAAPRVRVMSMEELSRRLDDRFGVLTGGSRTALPRHRTLRSLIDWSHELLGDAEKAVLRRASVFAGGWTLEAAEHVCSGDGVDRSDGAGPADLAGRQEPRRGGDARRRDAIRHARDRASLCAGPAARERRGSSRCVIATSSTSWTWPAGCSTRRRPIPNFRRSCFGSTRSTTTCVPRWRGAKPRRRVP